MNIQRAREKIWHKVLKSLDKSLHLKDLSYKDTRVETLHAWPYAPTVSYESLCKQRLETEIAYHLELEPLLEHLASRLSMDGYTRLGAGYPKILITTLYLEAMIAVLGLEDIWYVKVTPRPTAAGKVRYPTLMRMEVVACETSR